MTPFAKLTRKKARRRSAIPKETGHIDAADLVDAAHFFDVSEVTALATDLVNRCVDDGESITSGQFLPFPVTWMEYEHEDGERCALVLSQAGTGFADAIAVRRAGIACRIGRIPLGAGDAGLTNGCALLGHPSLPTTEVGGFALAAYAILAIINSDHTVVTHTARRETAPIARSILKRSRSEGAFPLRGWTEITLVAFHRRETEEYGAGGVARRVCWHEVRQHERHLRDGRIIIIPAHARGDKALGVKQTRYRVVPSAEGRGCYQ